MKHSKSYNKALEETKGVHALPMAEALALVEKTKRVKFDETIEVHINLGVDGKQADQQVRGTVVLPHGTGRSQKILVIAKGDKAAEAEKAGADFVGAEDMITKINGGWLGFDVCITTPDMMGMVGRIARVLGPKGFMPNPKSGTVTMDVKKPVADAKGGKVEYRLDKTNIIHCIIGKMSFGAQKLAENYAVLLDAIVKAKPAAAKGTYLKRITVCSSMGVGVQVAAQI